MYAKIEITGIIESVTGMHIGGSTEFAAIGAVDSPVIRDAQTNHPMIPGSSLKGKLRSLLARQYNQEVIVATPNDDDERILRLFGSSEKPHRRSRLIFSDMVLSNADELKAAGVSETEVKFENAINRISAEANPRQIERSVRGGKYKLNLIYNAEKEEEIAEDMQTLRDGLKLLEYDYLGGHGSRGYGKVKIYDIDADCVAGEIAEDTMDRCRAILGEVRE